MIAQVYSLCSDIWPSLVSYFLSSEQCLSPPSDTALRYKSRLTQLRNQLRLRCFTGDGWRSCVTSFVCVAPKEPTNAAAAAVVCNKIIQASDNQMTHQHWQIRDSQLLTAAARVSRLFLAPPSPSQRFHRLFPLSSTPFSQTPFPPGMRRESQKKRTQPTRNNNRKLHEGKQEPLLGAGIVVMEGF